jgi:hypothetical protein
MPKVPGVNHLQAVRVLEKAGFEIVRQGKKQELFDPFLSPDLLCPPYRYAKHVYSG